jgi:ubiquinol-cytochrome c reductase cytochrome b subunit
MWCGGQLPEGWVPLISLIGTIYWFAFFLIILPLLGIIEKPKALPRTIEEDFDNHYSATTGGTRVVLPGE